MLLKQKYQKQQKTTVMYDPPNIDRFVLNVLFLVGWPRVDTFERGNF
jgi:hypothetical protein